MDTQALKQNLHLKIDLIDDEKLLIDLNTIIENSDLKGIYKFTDFQNAQIERSLKQIELGQVISDEDLQIEIKKWLQEK